MADRELAGLRCSDVLELSGAFVLNALTPGEADAVRMHVAACPEAHAEVMELGAVVPALFETIEQVEAPAGLKERILASAAAEQAANRQRALDTQLAAHTQLADTQAPADTQRALDNHGAVADTQRSLKPIPAADTARRWDIGALFRRPIWAGVAAVAAVVAIGLGALNLQQRTEIESLIAYRNGVVEVLEEASRPGAQLAVLTAPENAPGPTGLAAVGADGSVAMVMRDLAPTAGTQVYEAWLIGAEGTPIPIGSFQVNDSRTASFTTARASLGPGVTVALSLEPQAGATTPTVVVALGAAQAQES